MNKYLKLSFLIALLFTGNGITQFLAMRAPDTQNPRVASSVADITEVYKQMKILCEKLIKKCSSAKKGLDINKDHNIIINGQSVAPSIQLSPKKSAEDIKKEVKSDLKSYLKMLSCNVDVISQLLSIKDPKVNHSLLTDSEGKIILLLISNMLKPATQDQDTYAYNIHFINLYKKISENNNIKKNIVDSDNKYKTMSEYVKFDIQVEAYSSQKRFTLKAQDEQCVFTGLSIKDIEEILGNSEIFLDAPNGVHIITPKNNTLSSWQTAIGLVAAVVAWAGLCIGGYYIYNTRHTPVENPQEPQEVEDIQIENQEIII